MKPKVKLRTLVELFRIQNVRIREIFGETLNEELLRALERKYATLGEFQEAEDKELINVCGETLYKSMSERVSEFLEDLIVFSMNVTNADYIPMPMKVAYGRLANDATLYFYPILELKGKINKLPDSERKFLEEYYGLSTGNVYEKIDEQDISKKFEIGDIAQYKKEVLDHLKNI